MGMEWDLGFGNGMGMGFGNGMGFGIGWDYDKWDGMGWDGMEWDLIWVASISTNDRYGSLLSEITISDSFGSIFAKPPLFFCILLLLLHLQM